MLLKGLRAVLSGAERQFSCHGRSWNGADIKAAMPDLRSADSEMAEGPKGVECNAILFAKMRSKAQDT
jgi:hypothetical protein